MVRTHELYPVTKEGLVLPTDVRRELLSEADRTARAYDHRVKQVMVSLATEVKSVLTVREDGQLSTDLRPLYRFNITVIAQSEKNRQTGSYGFGGRVPFSDIPDLERIRMGAREAARQAIVNLDARDCPSGTMPVVLGPGWPGILLHEAVGHGLEGDFN
ncbi:peptidase U62, modulator of DNA gyrase, partial [mine drainage metagenome]